MSCGVFVGNPSDEEGEEQEAFVSGTLIYGPVNGAKITLYNVDEEGNRGSKLGETTTDQSGEFELTVKYSGAVEAVATSGNYKDEATGENVVRSGTIEITALVPSLEESHLPIHALTHIAALNAKAVQSGEIGQDIMFSNKKIANLFGISGVPFAVIKPLDLTSEESVDTSGNDAAIGLLIAAFSQALEDNSINANELEVLIESVAKDFSDDAFDLKINGEDLTDITSLSPYDFMTSLETSLINFINSNENKSSMTESPISKLPDVPQTASGSALRLK